LGKSPPKGVAKSSGPKLGTKFGRKGLGKMGKPTFPKLAHPREPQIKPPKIKNPLQGKRLWEKALKE